MFICHSNAHFKPLSQRPCGPLQLSGSPPRAARLHPFGRPLCVCTRRRTIRQPKRPVI
ncbi:hypothetical protein CLOSTASPAR_00628 [[Clostridium] asparagiforme DSM 15981]|uniref:Uncharacterized protein n=1 Tax=[Clostridium] asparagiforme DSM 15981 TaxID=518636 RepID=C0CUT8_9FIRM|nr:hypothetical protein CLOSTASPAR_00628 [[Clostridium] asparagiforme DSM 15981]